jgi:hypothetical protein
MDERGVQRGARRVRRGEGRTRARARDETVRCFAVSIDVGNYQIAGASF